jgi:hypothetical protein
LELQAVTGLINVEQALVNAVFQQLNSTTTGGGHHHHIRREVRHLINLDGALTTDLTRLANQGLSSDPVYQQDLTNLVNIESELTQILTLLNPTG